MAQTAKPAPQCIQLTGTVLLTARILSSWVRAAYRVYHEVSVWGVSSIAQAASHTKIFGSFAQIATSAVGPSRKVDSVGDAGLAVTCLSAGTPKHSGE
jgi:hypothetical protein